jgi:hypothetical protein
MPRRRKSEPIQTPPQTRKRRRRTNVEQVAPQTEPAPVREPLEEPSAAEPKPLEAEIAPSPSADQDAALAEAEQQLRDKYPHANIKPGSLQAAGTRPGYGNKRTLIILCADCGAERVLPTSDVFHVSRCRDCARVARKSAGKKEH